MFLLIKTFLQHKGVELSFKVRRVERISAIIYYTFSSAQGTNSLSGSGLGSTEVNGNVPTVLIPLDYNQDHRGSISLDYRFDKDDGGPILEQLGVNVLMTFNSGHPYTLSQNTGLGQRISLDWWYYSYWNRRYERKETYWTNKFINHSLEF